ASDPAEFRYRHHDGYYVWLESIGTSILDDAKNFSGAVFTSRDISERRWMQRALVEQERMLAILQKEQELGSLKTRMMSRLSHELRTPLAVISTSSDLLEHYFHKMTDTQRQERLQQIRSQIKHFTSMLDNMSLVVKGINFNSEFASSPYDLEKLYQETIHEIRNTLKTT
ncbi:MAG: PAS domain S-box protein, partial [Anaerolineae bacterium]|nr:PAS domain S-box protein [Anaerolineae bacterium]